MDLKDKVFNFGCLSIISVEIVEKVNFSEMKMCVEGGLRTKQIESPNFGNRPIRSQPFKKNHLQIQKRGKMGKKEKQTQNTIS